MAIHYIPTEYRKPAMSTMGYFAQNMEPWVRALFGHYLEESAWNKRFEKEQAAQTAIRQEQAEAQGWQPIDYMKEPGESWSEQPDRTIGMKGYRKPIPKMINIEGERFLQYGTKLTHIPKADLTNWDKDYALLASGKITPEQFFAARGMGPKTQPETFGDLEFHKGLNAHIQRGSRGTVRKFTKEGWKPLTKEEAKAVTPSTTINIQGEKFDLGKRISASERRTALMQRKGKKDFFDAEADDFNMMSSVEVAYWDPSPRKLAKDGITKFAKLTKKNLEDGWTPATVQQFAEQNNLTTHEVLRRIGAIR